MPDSSFYFATLYPFQDDALRLVSEARTGFYLTGGTALSRGYLSHRLFGVCVQSWSFRLVKPSAAQSKSSGIYPVDLARRLCSTTKDDWEAVLWIEPAPDVMRFSTDLEALGDSLLLPAGL